MKTTMRKRWRARRDRRAAALERAYAVQDALGQCTGETDEYLRLNEECGRAWSHPDVPWYRHPAAADRLMLPVAVIVLLVFAGSLIDTIATGDALRIAQTIGLILLAALIVTTSWRQVAIAARDREQYRHDSDQQP